MQEEGYTPSDSIKLQMAKAFEKDGKPVPFQVPQAQGDLPRRGICTFWREWANKVLSLRAFSS